ncbi:hypothetical protein HYX15_03665 [Candidatus Woesearchaeota archaeon]|nr:hypothetical protein [Candidatus Woesearchaeota archaeon]
MKEDIKIEVMMGEYKSLRSESYQSMINWNKILSFYFSLILGISSIIIISDLPKDSLILYLIIFLILHSIIFILWFSEVERMFRVGEYLRYLEEKINKNIVGNDKYLHWENWLNNEKKHMKYPYIYTGIFFIISIVSLISGLIYFSNLMFILPILILIISIKMTVFNRALKMYKKVR